MKKLFTLLALIGSLAIAQAQAIKLMSYTTPGVATNLLVGNYIITDITLIATTATVTGVSFYDSATTSITNVVPAYVSYSGYATNITNIYVASTTGVTNTNTYAGWFTASITNSAATNDKPIIYVMAAPASAVVTATPTIGLTKGLTFVANTNCSLVVTYKNNPY